MNATIGETMANNRLAICSVDSDLNVIQSVTLAKHFGEAYTFYGSNWPDRFDKLFEDAYIYNQGLALIDEYMEKPMMPVYYHDIGDRWRVNHESNLPPQEQRECRVVNSDWAGQMWVYCHELACNCCGHWNMITSSSNPPKYCPNCGARVIEANNA